MLVCWGGFFIHFLLRNKCQEYKYWCMQDSIVTSLIDKLVAQGMTEEQARLHLTVKMSEIAFISPPDDYRPINTDDEFDYLRVMLQVGTTLQTKTVNIVKGLRRKRAGVQNVLKILRQRNPKLMALISDKWAHDVVRYAITNVGLFRNGKIDCNDVIKRSNAMVWFDKTSTIEIDYDKGHITVPTIDGKSTFTIKVKEMTKRTKLRNVRLTQDKLSDLGVWVHIHHQDDVLDERTHVQGILEGMGDTREVAKEVKEEPTYTVDLEDLFKED